MFSGGCAGSASAGQTSIITAARLSATFPYISSAARIKPERSPGGLHFVDGGYFDNDGTSTIVEFLASAFHLDSKLPDAVQKKTVRILLIEVRDGKDLDSTRSLESYCSQQSPDYDRLWDTNDQLFAPLGAFYETGHVAVTRRNRRELFLLMNALNGRAEVRHVIFPYDNFTPLSWHLTPRQLSDIDKQLADSSITRPLNDVATWMAGKDNAVPQLTVSGSYLR